MSQPKLKAVEGILYVVAEDDNYKPVFARTMDGPRTPLVKQILEALNLYKVTHPDGSEHFVFAESPTGAIGQSCTEMNVDFPERKAYEEKCITKQVPFRMRGWGSNLF